MPVVQVFECDNPGCSNMDVPEFAAHNKNDPSQAAVLTPPFGWLVVGGGYIGTGPDLKVCVCGNKCLLPAWLAALEQYEEAP